MYELLTSKTGSQFTSEMFQTAKWIGSGFQQIFHSFMEVNEGKIIASVHICTPFEKGGGAEQLVTGRGRNSGIDPLSDTFFAGTLLEPLNGKLNIRASMINRHQREEKLRQFTSLVK